MQKIIILAAGMALAATAAVGQSSWRDRDDDDRRGWRESRDRDETRGRSMRDHDDDQRSSRAARFVLRSGEARMAVRCDERESMRACVDAAITLFDKVRTQQATPSSAPASPGSSTSSPPR